LLSVYRIRHGSIRVPVAAFLPILLTALDTFTLM
jgi:hypothetical protein